jgi:SAM-dependent methyltransferase
MQSKGITELRDDFMRSAEFATRTRHLVGAWERGRRLPLDVPGNEIEYGATTSEILQCLKKIGVAWSHMGDTMPHFSVLTDKRYLPDALNQNLLKFWASGETEAGNVERMLMRFGCDDLSKKTCVEYGCGVGRVTAGLAVRFGVVHAYDISPSHLSLAKQRVQELGKSNCKYHLCADDPLGPLEACDVFYSKIVFQHNPPPVIVRLIENALGALKGGGVAVFQVPTYCAGYRFTLGDWLATEQRLGMEMHCLPQQVIFELVVKSSCELLMVREDNATGDDRFISNTFVIRKRTQLQGKLVD